MFRESEDLGRCGTDMLKLIRRLFCDCAYEDDAVDLNGPMCVILTREDLEELGLTIVDVEDVLSEVDPDTEAEAGN